jgi:catalase
MRWTRVGLTIAIILPFAWGSPAISADEDAPLGERLVDVMNQLFGRHPGLRANHTKGLVVEGSFTPSGAGATLSKAALFQGAPTPVTARFSDATGLPTIADGAPNANPHGLGLRFHLADGGEMDVVVNSLKFFPVATGEEFLALLQAAAASGPDVAKPTPLENFVAAHPTVPRALGSTSTPASYARETYNGINAFVLVDAAGERRPFRFRVAPVAGEAHLSAEEAARQTPDFLADELRARLAQGPVRFRLLAQLARAGDPTADPSQPWPDDRELVDLGEIALTQPAADNPAAEKELMLLPGNLPDGIEPSDDPMIDVRNEAYGVSFARRAE